MMQSEHINELAEALSKAQGMIEGATKDAKNPFFKSNYADLHSVMACAKEPLALNGLSVVQPTAIIDGQLCLITMLMHKSGQWIKSAMPIVLSKQDPQSVGSAITYYRRYSYSALVGISAIDDDGEAAMQRKPSEPAAIKSAVAEPTIDDLEKVISQQGKICDKASLGFYVKEKAIEHNKTEGSIIKQAIANNNGDLAKFIKGYEKRFPIPENPLDAA